MQSFKLPLLNRILEIIEHNMKTATIYSIHRECYTEIYAVIQLCKNNQLYGLYCISTIIQNLFYCGSTTVVLASLLSHMLSPRKTK